MQLRTTLGSADLTDPSWSSAYLRRKNTFLEFVPPLSESVMGFKAWRRQTSEPASPTAGRPASEDDSADLHDSTDLHDHRLACDSVAMQKPALAVGSLRGDEGSVAALPESLAACDGGILQISDEKLAGFSAWRRQIPKAATEISSSDDSDGRQIWSQSTTPASSPANGCQGRSFSKGSGITEAATEISSSDDSDGRQIWSQSATPASSPANGYQEGRSFSKGSGTTEATTNVGSPDIEDEDRSGFTGPKELAWRIAAGAKLARSLPAEGLATAAALVPRTEDGRPTSLGSFGHAAGTCRPCAYLPATPGCDAGILCRFCHFDHPGLHKSRARPCKGKRERFRKLLSTITAQLDEDPTSFDVNDDRLPPSIKFDSRMKAKLSAKMSRYAEDVRRQQEAVVHTMPMPG